MRTKTFTLLLLGLLLFGGGLGGSFVAGLLIGSSQEAEAAPVVAPSVYAADQGAAPPSTAPDGDGSEFADLIERAQSGELSEDEMTTLREQFQSRSQGAGGRGRSTGWGGFGGRGPALTGTVTVVEGNVLTLSTAQGDLQVYVGEDITIRQTVEVAIEDLPDGTRITVIGQSGDDGVIAADTIQVIPEGVDFTGGGGWGGFGGVGRGETDGSNDN